MKASTIISLIYAHATKDDDMWARTIDRLVNEETLKGNDVLACDIRDADYGILHTGPEETPSAKAVLSERREKL